MGRRLPAGVGSSKRARNQLDPSSAGGGEVLRAASPAAAGGCTGKTSGALRGARRGSPPVRAVPRRQTRLGDLQTWRCECLFCAETYFVKHSMDGASLKAGPRLGDVYRPDAVIRYYRILKNNWSWIARGKLRACLFNTMWPGSVKERHRAVNLTWRQGIFTNRIASWRSLQFRPNAVLILKLALRPVRTCTNYTTLATYLWTANSHKMTLTKYSVYNFS